MNMAVFMKILVFFVISTLFLTGNCRSIENKKDLARAESETLERVDNRVEEVKEVARGSVPGLELNAVKALSDIPGKNAQKALLNLIDESY
jgi:hypothetical protein